jgi:CheY-like chemotaxis protein
MSLPKLNENPKISCTILVADDDPDDRFLLSEAFQELQDTVEMHFVEDGEELMNYLYCQGKDTDFAPCPQVDLVFLDLNMPKKNGRQALSEIKADKHLSRIPVIVWTSSSSEEDITFCLQAGADACYTKPARYEEMVEAVMGIVAKYSFQ